jgi:hypothetical protein
VWFWLVLLLANAAFAVAQFARGNIGWTVFRAAIVAVVATAIVGRARP